MKKNYPLFPKSLVRLGLFTTLSVFPYLGLQAQNVPTKSWDKTIGAAGFDNLTSVKQTADGGYILGGHSDSGISGDKTQASFGAMDYWIVKTDATGSKLWDKTFGGGNSENFRYIQQTADGGYILAGYTDSGISGSKTQASKGGFDYWIVKVDASGNKTWDKTFGGSLEEKLFVVQQTADGGYILGGSSKSGIGGDKSQAGQGDFDFWVVKLDAAGTKTWDKTFGGTAAEELYTLRQTADGGYILGGTSKSGVSGDKTQASKGLTDYWIIKIDGTGTKTWDKTFGGSGEDVVVFSIQQTTDGGYVFAGTSASGISGDKTEASKGGDDFWIVKTDAAGVKTWDKTVGGSSAETMRTMQQTADGGYVMGGFSTSPISGDKTEASKGMVDYWVVKLNATGTKSWDKTIGAANADNLHSLHQTTDGGYILGGMSDSGLSGDKSQAAKGGSDFWVVKLSSGVPAGPNDVSVNAIPGLASGCVRTSQETISVTVENKGTASQINIPVSYRINSGAWVNEIILGPLAPNTSITYPFLTKANLSTVGSYVIRAKTMLAGDMLAVNDSLKQTISLGTTPAAATVTAGGSTSICTGGSVTLTAASATPGVTYQWFKDGLAISGATAATYAANATGSYTATALSSGCAGPASAPTVLTMTTPPIAPVLNANGPLAICVNGSVTFTVSSVTGATFTWFKNNTVIPGATAITYTATTAGNYTVTAALNGCGSPASQPMAVTLKGTPSTPSITQTGFVLSSSSIANNQWYLNGVLIPGATNRNFTATTNGVYTVVVTSAGCSSAHSVGVSITTLGFGDDMNSLEVSVYPNPSNGMFHLTLPEGQVYEITVTDLTGKVVNQFTTKEQNARLNISKVAKGVYFLKIRGEEKVATRKLIVE